jgi:hypothetical protein
VKRSFFPATTGIFKAFEEPAAFRRLLMSIVEIAAITGIVVRLYRAFAWTHGPYDNVVYVTITFIFGVIILLTMVTLHLGNYTIRQWIWRAPIFAAIEATAESLTSLVLILLHREPMGMVRAQLADWGEITGSIFFWRLSGIILYALVLAGVVQFIRNLLLRAEHRGHTVDAVHQQAEAVLEEPPRP